MCDEADDACVDCLGDGDCDDGLFCNGAEVCDVSGSCQPGTPPVLDDGVDCTEDSCDEANDTVLHSPDDAICNDGFFCNGVDSVASTWPPLSRARNTTW